jgi:hypothetical protein
VAHDAAGCRAVTRFLDDTSNNTIVSRTQARIRPSKHARQHTHPGTPANAIQLEAFYFDLDRLTASTASLDL